ncbi:uncharacterized protein LOC118467496 isoform X2 [Anopheles albimanus]|uniref:uncharacterized protein LOC118467496 isoform X2 n=1 Tax=Anopheles albimanus TaxID=7167 RepID=UPI00163E2BFF|nr:uncharacterized protein LOC118467496 isoform X2 [Anopheles albimanus]
MTSFQIFTPVLPYVGQLPSELRYGSHIKVRGHFREPQATVHIILQREALLNPNEEVPLCLMIHPERREIVRHRLCSDCSNGTGTERVRDLPIERDQDFELSIVATSTGYEMALHGTRHHTFPHRMPLSAAQFLFVSSGCVVFAITFENGTGPIGGSMPIAGDYPQQPTAPPMHPAARLYPTLFEQKQIADPTHHQHHHGALQPQPLSLQHHQHQLTELILQVLPLMQLQLEANGHTVNARSQGATRYSHGLLTGNLARNVLPLFQQSAGRRRPFNVPRFGPRRSWVFCPTNDDIMPAVIWVCSIGLVRLLRFLAIGCICGYIGYVFSRNV